MNSLYYLSSRGTKIDLFNWPLMAQNYESLLEYEWEHKGTELFASGTKVSISRQKMKEVELLVSVLADSSDEFNEIQKNMINEFDYDIRNNSPGRLYWDGTYLKCFISGSSFEEYEEDFDATDIKLKVKAPNPFWIEENAFTFSAESSGTDADLNYPHNYPHNYSLAESGEKYIDIDSSGESEFEMIMYGPCSNPSVSIGGHTYSVTCELISGEYLRIDTRRKMVKELPIAKVGSSGTETNLFNNRNKTYSVFEKIKPGSSEVTWSGSFKWDLTVFIERSVPL